MDLSYSKDNIGYFPQICVCDEHISTEKGSDFSLPDYQPEIRRLLSYEARLTPPSVYIGEGSAEISGEIIYKIIYLAADGLLYSCSLGDKYTQKAALRLPYASADRGSVTVIPLLRAEKVGARVLAPRKLNVRSVLEGRALAFAPALYAPEAVGAHDPACVENLILETPSIKIAESECATFTLTDFVTPEGMSDSLRIVDSEITPIINDCSASAGKINIGGEVLVRIICSDDATEEAPIGIFRRLPFTCSAECAEAGAGAECCGEVFLVDEEIGIDSDGISVRLELCARGVAQSNISVPYVADSYSTERETECKTEEVEIMRALRAACGALSCNETFRLDELGLSPQARPVYVGTAPTLNDISAEGGRLYIRGECEYSVIYLLDGEYSVCRAVSPIKYELECRRDLSERGDIGRYVSVIGGGARARIDSERLFIDAELSFSVLADCTCPLTLVGEISFGEMRERASGDLILCYPPSGSELWSIAKRYGVSESRLREQNSLSSDASLDGKKFLII